MPKDARRNQFCCPEHYNLWRTNGNRGLNYVEPVPQQKFSNADEAWKFLNREIGRTERENTYPKKRDKKTRKFVLVSDIQTPFQRDDVIIDICKHEADADVLIISGDLTDSYSLSNYTKTRNIPFREEWGVAVSIVEKFSTIFPEVWILKGNHDIRLEKRLQELLSVDMLDAIKTITGGVICPINTLANKFKNVKLIGHNIDNINSIDWIHQFGDAIVMHAEKYSVMPGAVMRKISEWLADFEIAFNISTDYRVIFQSHTHAYLFMPYRADQILIETGCACNIMPYQTTAKIGARPQRVCYITFEQTDGVTDINSIRTRFYN